MNLLSFKSVIKHFVRKLYRPHFIPANFMQTFGIDSQSQIQYFVYSSNWKHFMKNNLNLCQYSWDSHQLKTGMFLNLNLFYPGILRIGIQKYVYKHCVLHR